MRVSDLRAYRGPPYRQIGVLPHISSASKALSEVMCFSETSQAKCFLFPPREICFLCPLLSKKEFYEVLKCFPMSVEAIAIAHPREGGKKTSP